MLLLISDANVLIDIEDGGLTAALFSLDCRIAVPDVVFAEELSERHSHLRDLGLEIHSLGSASVAYAERLASIYRRPSRNDLLALVLAKQEDCPLVTGDKALRDAATAERVTLYGTLWLVERMIRERRITVAVAEQSFAQMRDRGSRLPWDTVAELLATVSTQGDH